MAEGCRISLFEARKAVEREADGRDLDDEEGEEEEEPYEEVTPLLRGQSTRGAPRGVSTPRGGRSRQAGTLSTIGAPRNRGYDGRPLSQKMLRLERAKKDL
ncbi:hypothetical protein BU23DRAFT_562622 [Bimuria novae-zelandiae CBS 107.79]|uniref:Uncharacterized protein n=1 Tax=Bimuria novae-zelandiae CBS 107.79 TaxID=1447943 RepID=A0A6A5VZD8_9PLEO|nr:hypothetical protein BU23DRAFT_562622 [Bimuria novae-zelandiae CBS 107.79]